MNKIALVSLSFATLLAVACTSACDSKQNINEDKDNGDHISDKDAASQNIKRAIQITDAALEHYFTDGIAMTEFYNPFTGYTSSGTVDVWPYTSSIEAVNAIMSALSEQKESGNNELYDQYFEHYKDVLSNLYDGLEYYSGTFTLTSYTQTNTWTVYGVHRGSSPGSANVAGIENVYDDQQWLIRELLEAYKLTGNNEYLEKAEYLAEYVIDGWDCTLDPNGTENGGITWGPGYTTKHSCSNGPFISPLVWLSEYYKGKGQTTEYRYVDSSRKRLTRSMDKSEYYMMYARKVYEFQKSHLMNNDGVYYDMLGGPSGLLNEKGEATTKIHEMDDTSLGKVYETIDGVKYKAYLKQGGPTGNPLSYNSGTMLSGAADLYKATQNATYKQDMEALTDACFSYFAKLGTVVPEHYTYAYDGFNNWFNGVMMRGWADVYSASQYDGTASPLKSFQDNLDYG